jgi:hypothetical protein
MSIKGARGRVPYLLICGVAWLHDEKLDGLMSNVLWLEHRRTLLSAAINYVEEQREDLADETREFLAWAKVKLDEAETALRAAENHATSPVSPETSRRDDAFSASHRPLVILRRRH